MERKNQFDDAIKAKIGQLEDEPSARVWAGVQQNIGAVRPPVNYAWPLRMAAGVILLCTAGLAFYFSQSSGTAHTGLALREQSRVKRIVIVPLDRTGPGTFLANDQNAEPQLHNAQPRRQDQSFAIAPHDKVTPQDSLKNLAPWNPMPEEEKREVVHNESPKPLEAPAPLPDPRVPQPQKEDQPDTRTLPAIASTNTKHSYKLPNRDDFASDNLKRKSGAILGAITNGANTFLGLNANYEEHHQDDTKLTAFNADFGLFKIKKVRTIKN